MLRRALLVLILLASVGTVTAIELSSFEVTNAVVSGSDLIVGDRADLSATFSSSPDPSQVAFNVQLPGGVLQHDPASCVDTTCTLPGVPMPEDGPVRVYVTYGLQDWPAQHRWVTPDREGPVITGVSFSFGSPSSVSFSASDPSGISSYRLKRGGSTIADGTEASGTVELATPLIEGADETFVLRFDDAFGNPTVRVFGGTVDTTPPQIGSIEPDAVLADGAGIVSFTVVGERIDVGTIRVSVDGASYGAVCAGSGPRSCTSRVETGPGASSVTITASNEFGSTVTETASVSFSEDDQDPEYLRMTTPFAGYTTSDTGYAFDSLDVEFVENGLMDPATVIVSVDGTDHAAESCRRVGLNVRCSVPFDPPAEVLFRSAYDLAGNEAVIGEDPTIDREFEIDTVAPEVRSFALYTPDTGASQASSFAIPAPQDIQAVITVRAEGSRIGELVVSGEPENGDPWTRTFDVSCDTPDNEWAQCLSDPIPIDEPTQLSFEVHDASGSPFETNRVVTIGSAPSGVNEWEIVRVDAMPPFYLPDGSLPLTIEAELGTQLISSALTIGGVTVESCSGLSEPFASSLDETVTITGYSDASALGDGTATCTISVTSVRNGRAVAGAQSLEIEVELEDLSSAGYDDIDDAYARSEGALAFGSVLGTLNSIKDYATVMCDAYYATNNVSGVVNAAAAALGGDVQISPIGAALSAAGVTLFRTTEAVGEIADPLCPYVKCRTPTTGDSEFDTVQESVISKFDEWERGTREDINGALGFDVIDANQPGTRIEDSLVLSTVTMCVPGVIENVNEYAQIKCGYRLCLLKVKNGDYAGSVSTCEYAHGMQMCSYLGDQAFATFPYLGFVQEIGGSFGSIVERPLQLAIDWALSAAADVSPTVRAVLNENLGGMLQLVLAGVEASSGNAPADYCTQLNEYMNPEDGDGA